jgi:hypothetical protein
MLTPQTIKTPRTHLCVQKVELENSAMTEALRRHRALRTGFTESRKFYEEQ